ncbi:type IV toxin-antitoxin system AbiEi family antitoxin domain-containing protein [Leucobacter chinensis]|uniref:type IV toxin-antitoxin system AbiEi family antitoxin domain-containing protein n=1 Tax=Leucobacter chinensis TaxID=2851010 RepID=UPI001C21F518|nr:type IV toxin-antitoxin system AbiEi family antitoxin domain-containing protein [Leucobacter chinensis]
MNSNEALRELASVTVSQWGMVTTAQAASLGVSRLMLSRLAEAEHLERLSHGVYKDVGVPSDQYEDLRAAWLSTEPKLRAEERVKELASGVVVASSSAAMLHGVGDLWANRHEFVVSKRRQTQRSELRFRQRQLEERDVTLVNGLPAMTLERTLADLLEDVGEMSLVADALGIAVQQGPLDLDRLRALFSPLAERNGFTRNDGGAVLEHLMQIAGIDLTSVARRLAADQQVGTKILEQYLQSSPRLIEALGLNLVTAHIEERFSEISADLVQKALGSLDLQQRIREIVRMSMPEIRLGRDFSELFPDLMTMRNLKLSTRTARPLQSDGPPQAEEERHSFLNRMQPLVELSRLSKMPRSKPQALTRL